MTNKPQISTDITGNTPKEKWNNLKQFIIDQTEKIDKETEWRSVEPDWWLEMSAISQNIKSLNKNI